MPFIRVTVKRPPAIRNFALIFNQLALVEGRKRAKTMERSYQASTNTWSKEHKPQFVSGCELRGGRTLVVYAGYDNTTEAGRIYSYVDLGVEPHGIDPRGHDTLKFMDTRTASYSPHTQPGRLQSTPKVYEGGDYVYPWHVDHPGIEARGFTKQVQERHGNADWIEGCLIQAMQRAGLG